MSRYIPLARTDPEPATKNRNGHLVQEREQPELGASSQADLDSDEPGSIPAGKGDAWEGDELAPPQTGTDCNANSPAQAVPLGPAQPAGGEPREGVRRGQWSFPVAQPISQLQVSSEEIDWVWKGFLGIDSITMLS